VRLKYTSFPIGFVPNYIIWIISGIFLSLISAACVREISPQAAGAGVPEMKSILSGLLLHHYLSFRCLISKIIGIVTAQAAGLSVGIILYFIIF
jgi:H+/Cl- antiporter ClcA